MLVREASLHAEGNKKPLKGSKREQMCVCVTESILNFQAITLAALWGMDWWGQECKQLEQ